MDYLKTTLRVGLVVVILTAFVEIPYAAAIIAVLGLAVGVQRDTGDLVRTLIIAIGLSIVAGALGEIPAVGGYLTDILTSVAALAAASAVGVFGKWTWEQVGM
jgi:hypothetical protein